MALQFSGSAFTGSSAGLALRGQAEGKVENWVCVAVPAEGEVAEPQRPSQSQSHVQSYKGVVEERRIAGISMMQQRPKNSRRWIVPGSCAGPDGLTHRAVKKEVAVDPAVVDFSADLSRLKNSRKWSAARAEASSVIRSSGWRMHKTMAARVEAGNGSGGLTYKAAGVDIDAGAELVRRIAAMTPGIGGFGGLYPFGDSYLVAGTDGVGTKLKLAFETGIHDTIGIDLVAMSVNDIVTSGAKPLFFLDYFATSTLDVDLAEKVIQGIVEGCRMSDCALLGGETAEMPDFYAKGEYDLSGFAVGAVKKDRLIDGSKIVEGDVIIGLASSGVHSNGYSLVRKIIEKSGVSLNDELPNGGGITIGQALMVPTRIYVPEVMKVVNRGGVKGIAHITGGGFTENIPRIFPDGLGAHVELGQWKVPPIFHWLQKAGDVTDKEMFRTFNMGIGMVLVVDSHAGHSILTGEAGIGKAYRIGTVKEGDGVVFNSKKST